MKIVVKPAFYRDISKLRNKEIRARLDDRITKIEAAKSISQIPGLKQLRSFKVHYRIKVETDKHSYRIGAIIRDDTIWLVRFLPRRKIYKEFP